MKELVSIIVPIYNTEQHHSEDLQSRNAARYSVAGIKRCIDSLLTQNYAPIEILLINGSGDDAVAQLCAEYSLKDERIRIFNIGFKTLSNTHGKQNINNTLSYVKNFGLDNVSGSWVTFCDIRDFVGRTYVFSFMYRRTLHKDCLYVTGRREGINDKKLRQKRGIFYSGEINQEMLDKIQKNPSVYGKLFNRKTLNRMKLRFDENIFYDEDKLFTMQYLKEMKEVAYNRKYFPYNKITRFDKQQYSFGFEPTLLNYKAVATQLQKMWDNEFNYCWLTADFKHLFYCTLYEKVSDHQKSLNLQKLRDEKHTKELLEELIASENNNRFIWKLFLKRKYTLICNIYTFGNWILRLGNDK